MNEAEFDIWLGAQAASCPGRGAAFFTLRRRAGTVANAALRYGPGLAAHHAAKSGALRSIRGTRHADKKKARLSGPSKSIQPNATD